MKTITFIMMFFGLLAMTLAAPGIPAEVLDVHKGNIALPYPLVPLRVTGKRGEYEFEHFGTIQEVNDQIKANHPDYEAYLASTATNETATASLAAESKLSARGGKVQPPHCCPVGNWGWGDANVFYINKGIDHLNHVSDLCHVEAKACTRISCSWASAIILCNDNDYEIHPTCPYMGSYAQDLINRCQHYIGQIGLFDYAVCGQFFDSDNYNIIVRYDNC